MRACVATMLAAEVATGCTGRTGEPVAAPEPQVRTAKLIFIGDVMSHSPQVAAARTGDDYDYSDVFRHVRPIFEGADVVIANLETTLRTSPPYTGYPMFAAPAQLAFAMRRAGIDIVTTANNHMCDKGAAGIRSTLDILDSAGIRHTGVFTDEADRTVRNPLRFTAGGLRFALLAYTYGTNGMPVPGGMTVNLIDTAAIARDLAAAKFGALGEDIDKAPDCVIVAYHWGAEYRPVPATSQRELAAWTRARGADLVIGTHPHVVEPMEAHYNADSTAVTGATFYSLGNFVSNQRERRTDGGIAAEITVTGTELPPCAAAGDINDTGEVGDTSVSLSMDYDLAYRLLWVHTPWRHGAKRYEVLPVAVADTMLAERAADSVRSITTRPADPAFATYRRFVCDTRALLGSTDSVLVELK